MSLRIERRRRGSELWLAILSAVPGPGTPVALSNPGMGGLEGIGFEERQASTLPTSESNDRGLAAMETGDSHRVLGNARAF